MWANRGFRFQDAYALWRMAELLTCQDGLIAVRYEGAQDVDLMYADGRQKFIQLKNRPDAIFNWDYAIKILSSFASDERDALCNNGNTDSLSFCVVTTSVPTGQNVDSLSRGINVSTIARSLRDALGSANGWHLKAADKLSVAKKVVTKTVIDIRTGIDPTSDMRELAAAKLMRFGVQPEDVDAVLARFADALIPRCIFSPADILDMVSDYLTTKHPARNGMIRITHAHANEDAFASAFYSKGAFHWSAIASGLDVRRDVHDLLLRELAKETPSLHLLVGAGGAGKTTLAKRVGWELHSAGKVIGVDWASSLADNETWNSLIRVSRALQRPILIFVDDLFRNDEALEQIQRMEAKQSVIFLATTRRHEINQAKLKNAYLEYKDYLLNTVTYNEVELLCQRLSLPLPDQATINKFKKSGNIFVLIMTLIHGSVERFATEILEPIRHHSDKLLGAYLDLCLSGRFDRSVPKSVLLKRWGIPYLEKVEVLESLIFEGAKSNEVLRSGHANLSQSVIEVEKIDPALRAIQIGSIVSPSDAQERRFAIGMFHNLTHSSDIVFARTRHEEIKAIVESLIPHADLVDSLRLQRISKALGFTEFEDDILKNFANPKLSSGQDAAVLLFRAKTAEEFQRAFPILLNFFNRDDTSYARRNFIARCAHQITETQKRKVLNSTLNWLKRHCYPVPECKSFLDVIQQWAGVDRELASAWVVDIITAKSKEAQLFRVASSIQANLRDPAVLHLLLQQAENIITAENVREDANVFTFFVRAVRDQIDDTWRERLTNHMIGVVRMLAESFQNEVMRPLPTRLLEELLYFVSADRLEDVRVEVINIATLAKITEKRALSLKFIRASGDLPNP